MALPYSIAHGHPEEECQQRLTGAQRASSGEVHSPTRLRRGAFRIVKERYKNGVFKGGRKFFEICED